MIGCKFDTEMFPDAAVGEGVEELILRRSERRYAAHIHRYHTCGRVNGDHRLWTKTDTQSVKPSTRGSRERHWVSCAASSWT